MRIAITWPDGGRATALTQLVEERGHTAVPISNGAGGDRTTLRQQLRGVDALVHLPPLPAEPVTCPAQHPMVVETFDVLAAAMSAGVGRFVLATPHPTTPPATTTALTTRALHVPPHAAPPTRAEVWCEKIVGDASAQGLDTLIVNHGALIGPFDRAPTPIGRLVLAMAQRRLRVLVPWRADCIDVRDVASGIFSALRSGQPGQRYALNGHVRREVELARVVHTLTGHAVPSQVLPSAFARILRLFVDPESAVAAGSELQQLTPPDQATTSEELGFIARPFEASVLDTLRWFSDQGMLAA
jgi:dihydroflavonol-4-reductase